MGHKLTMTLFEERPDGTIEIAILWEDSSGASRTISKVYSDRARMAEVERDPISNQDIVFSLLLARWFAVDVDASDPSVVLNREVSVDFSDSVPIKPPRL